MKKKLRFGAWGLNTLLVASLFFSMAIIVNDHVVDPKTAMQVYGLAAVLFIVKISTTKKIVVFGPTYIILLYTIISCFGYDILVMLNPSEYETIASLRHSYMDYFNLANAYYHIGVFSFVFGIMMSKRKANITPEKKTLRFSTFSPAERKLFMNLSLGIIYFYILWLVFEVVTGRLPLTNYIEVKDFFRQQSALMYILRATWVAMPTYLFFAEKKDLPRFLIPVSVMFIILMFTGNRNEILYPLAIAIGVYVWRMKVFSGKGVPKSLIIGTLILVLVINPMVSNTRKDGFETLLSGSFGLRDALLEMGQQLNPFSIILSAIDTGIYSFQYGMTMIVPSLSISTLNFIVESDLYKTTFYNPSNVLNYLGHYGRGFSYIAEIYINFGVLGIVIAFFLLGKLSSYIESVCSNSRRLLFFFQLGSLFMLWSRNVLAFNFVIVIFAVLLQITVEVMTARRRRITKSKRTLPAQLS
ncbi:O-antigen polysaccharide polymerase Wzy family protein [Paenibacillus timonensis]|uniref:O-antigen polysaccharide polymerase Wzy n=1 Tax=Paenibacillus timonensis TaxID=225915 RepID=A0ABW3SCU8_9BACL|nr:MULTISPECIES: O-antigen polysaccharide polymerase Wzy [Paenibacillus]MCH1640117.1 O-antigen polysaccharide polymerase Wzy family protein [Paenibacillus timonensis]MDU2239850.1 O-antigen polysaccharide polymerase Wzy [Paenibacillus sp.]